jgi:hypothetical protein
MAISFDFEELDPLPIERDLLYSVFIINRYAKKFEEDGEEMYKEANGGVKAKVCSIRKNALYSLKTEILHRLMKGDTNNVRVEKHILDGGFECWCFIFEVGDEEFAYHQPSFLVADEVLDMGCVEEDDEGKDIEYEAAADIYKLDNTLEEALRTVSEYGIDPNSFLEQEEVKEYDSGASFPTVFHFKEK